MTFQMSQNQQKETKAISVRDLTPEDKDRIRKALKYGDAAKIARRVSSVTYVTVMNTFNPEHSSDVDEVWLRALEYFAELPKVEMDERRVLFFKGESESEQVAA